MYKDLEEYGKNFKIEENIDCFVVSILLLKLTLKDIQISNWHTNTAKRPT